MRRLFFAFGCFLLVARVEGCSVPVVPYAYMNTNSKPYSGRYRPGTKLYFDCHDGYTMEGRSMIECNYSYRWNYDPPKCYKKKVMCMAPKHNDYYHMPYSKSMYGKDESMEYKCRYGYYTPSNMKYEMPKCMDGGNWNKAPYKCMKYCPNPKTFFGGEFYPDKPNYMYMDKVYYACPGKYHKYIYSTCEKDGGWKQAKLCYDYCEMPEMKHGYYEPKKEKYSHGDTITYYCDKGYYKYYTNKEYKMAKCGEDGTWDMKKPMCKKYCKAPSDYKMYNHMPYSKTMYKMGEKIMYHCMEGSSPPSHQKYKYSTCMDSGMWDGKPYKCEKTCMAPDHTEYYHQPYGKQQYKPRERITYRCMEGYYHWSGYEYGTASCMADGSWNNKPDHCTKYCTAPKMFKHGYYNPSKKAYKYGEKMYYYCDEGYQMYYKKDKYEYNTCDRKGKWRYMEPMCKKYCAPPMMKHLYYTPKMDKYNVGDNLKYECKDGYRLVFGKDWFEKNTCGEDGQWMFEPPTCQEVFEDVCEPPKMMHGSYKPMKNSYKYMDKVMYMCDEGYQMYKEEEWEDEYSTCMKGGKWKYMTPMCKPKMTHYCKPPMIMNGLYRPPKKSYMTDDRVYFYCHDGYNIYFDKDWFEYATCLKDGNFDFKPPKCIDMRKTYCDPPEFMHGIYMPNMHKYEEGDRVYYECKEGYQIYYGDDWFEFSSCMSDGTWDFDPPMCRKVYSDERQFCYPPEFPHGSLRPSKSMYEVDEKLYYECEGDYTKYYHEDIYEYCTCQRDGTWDKKAPMCKSKYKDYCQPPTVMHGSYMPKMKMYNPGDRIRYSCDYGYDMHYEDHSYYYATCMQDGMWDNKPVMCKHSQTMYCKKPILEHGVYKPMRKMYNPGDRIYFTCNAGYEVSYYGGKKFECRICGKDGNWDHKMPTCKMVKKQYCDPPMIEHGTYMKIKDKYMVGDMISYKCKEGYMLFYENDWFVFSTCKLGGYWDFKAPLCKEKILKYCHPPDYHYGYYMPRMRLYKEGVQLYYKCYEGYKMHYKDDMTYDYNTCKDGKWKYESPKCIEMKKKYCKSPVIMHGMYEPMMDMYMKGDRVWHKCMKGYMMEEEHDMEYSTCKEDGMWDMKPPTCKKKSTSYCMHSKIRHGHYMPKKPFYSRGERVSYRCDYGYEMQYHDDKPYQHATCKSDGNWDYEMPKCTDRSKKYCMAPDVMHSMYMPMKKYYGYGDRVYFKCKYGYYLYYGGYYHQHSTCTAMGKWDILPVCKEMQKKYCKAPYYNDYHHKPYAKKYYMAGEWMKYECSPSYYPQSKEMKKYALCKADGKWDYAPMKCMKYCMVDDMKYRYYKPMKKYYMPGDEITYSCKDGYYTSDRNYMKTTCMNGGKWDQKGPMCTRPCYAPYYFPNGKMYGSKYSYDHGERMTLYCDRGYEMSSEKNYVECGYYGKWKTTLPSCRRN